MAEKFPPLENENFDSELAPEQEETDFLKREAELLGDEFKTEQDSEFLQDESNGDDDFGNFEEVPAPSEGAPAGSGQADMLVNDLPEERNAHPSSESEAVSHWKENRVREIDEKDAAQKNAKTKLQEEAAKHMDDFYDTYNRKKEQQLKSSRDEAEKFTKEKDGFFSQSNTTWDRVLQLINVDDADLVNGRDRSKFKELLIKLKGNTSAPGA
ncbi:LADA_0D11122g1_1 [Lachancea dasiensis]|uniref:Clathrin light chain n=1 Tax=Lachancea dasiensis TaxID=1072105 RepID=A0A1G4J8A8_9SACH|nr:LADA_0D11122g1_1 [Lachancea dasiensis]